ncbi:MAG: inositol monophosphatase family protein [Candidatus Kapaibacterium sp.]
MKTTDIEKFADIALAAALRAGDELKKGFGTAFEIGSKEGRNNLVTEYDHRSEEIIIDYIKREFPDHKFLAEESGISGKESEETVRWVIDPLDGTVNYAHGIPIFCISIAAEYNGELLNGLIYQPLSGELFVARRGQGATLNGKKLQVSDNDDFSRSFLVTGFPYNASENPCNCIDLFVEVIQRGIPVRRLGAAALDLAYVAAGRFDGFWEIDLKPWDVAAGTLIVREAGGLVTQYDSDDFHIFDNSILATNGILHGTLQELLIKCREKCNL